MSVALCVTVLNEAASIELLLDSIEAQTRLPDSIVIVDGGSRDATVGLIRRRTSLPIRLIEAPGLTIAAGRNLAIAGTDATIIAVTDAGVRLAPDWLARIVSPIDDGVADVSAGFFLADPRSDFETAMAATVLPLANEVDSRFLPSSRSIAFRRVVWEQVGGYPEWLDYCEDLLFDLAYREAGFRQATLPQAVVWFRPRSSLRAFWLQYARYARGDGKADLWRKRQATRYATFGIIAPALVLLGRHWPAARWILALGGVLYVATPVRRFASLTKGWPTPRRFRAALWLPVIRLTGDIAKMVGYPAGVRWRLRHRRPV